MALAHAESLYGAMRAQSKMWGGGRGRGNKYQVSQMGGGRRKERGRQAQGEGGEILPLLRQARPPSPRLLGQGERQWQPQHRPRPGAEAEEAEDGGRGGQNRYNPTSTRGRGANRGGRSTGWNTSKRTISEVHAEEQPQEDVEWTEGSETQEQEESEN